jgi:nicotinamide-nucleotide amidase
MQIEFVALCRSRGLTVGTAESLTAGLVASKLAEVPGASAVLRGGVVAYATEIKHSVLGLSESILDHVVSETVATQMAISATRVLGADVGLATTGVAGPDPLDGQPPGSFWLAVHHAPSHTTVTKYLQVAGDRGRVRDLAATAVIALACELFATVT